MIKLYAWEASFEERIGELREKEMKILKTVNILQSVQIALYDIIPLLVSAVS